MKEWDLHAPAGKIELALKTLQITEAAVESQWTDEAKRRFQETHMSAVEPNVRSMLDAISQLDDVLNAARRQCRSEDQ
ncbi:MAG: WXG100 family type VII secretion target [Planctomycetaceae bacterium]|nr:WXG100 family type VII secretion target [Planctomycetaceae bacterium]